MILLLFFAFLSGIITVLSPCILPVLPLLLSAGLGQGKYRPYGIIIGVIVSFTFFTLTLTALVQTLGISPNVLRYISLGLIIFFGLTLIYPPLEHFFARVTAPLARIGNKLQSSTQSSTGFLSGFILGTALGLIWAPCAGPILATITTLVATGSVTLSTVVITLAYSLGTALPMFLIILGGSKLTSSLTALSAYTEIIRKVFGALMIISALAIAFHFDVILQQLTLNYFPVLKIEDNHIVKNELDKLQAQTGSPDESPIPVIGKIAPNLKGITSWINSPALTLKELKGKVVLIDFWTYSCINCVRTVPYLKKWHEAYADKGLVILGVHTPEFEFEKNESNVQNAVKRFNIPYPVALDTAYATWKNYYNRYWPAHYLIDQQGILRLIHYGEGEYIKTENTIRSLLGLPPLNENEKSQPRAKQTPEIYLGSLRGHNYGSETNIVRNKTSIYSLTNSPVADHIGLQGSWLVMPEFITSKGSPSSLVLHFTAGNVYAVMSSEKPTALSILLDGKPVPISNYTVDMNSDGTLPVSESRMYHLLDLKKAVGTHILTLEIPEGVSLYAFTFGI